jgi:hypothetical protein
MGAAAATNELAITDLVDLPIHGRPLARGRFVHVVTGHHWLELDIVGSRRNARQSLAPTLPPNDESRMGTMTDRKDSP